MDSTTDAKPRSKKLYQALEDVLLSQNGSDVTFVVHGKELKAHKLIVSARSPVLKAMIESPMAPADQRHEIADPEISYEDFLNFMVFLYTDKCVIEKSNFKALLHLGNFYDVPYLHEKCAVAMVLFELYCADFYKYAEMALQYAPTSSAVLEKCFHKLSSCHHCDGPLAYYTDEEDCKLKWISADLVLEIVKHFPRNRAVFTEDALFKKVFQWANHECVRRGLPPTSEAIAEIMLPFMQHFKAEAFSLLTLATTVKKYNLLPAEQLIEYLCGNIVKEAEGDEHCHRGRHARRRPAGDRNNDDSFRKRHDNCPNHGRYAAAYRYNQEDERVYDLSPSLRERYGFTIGDEREHQTVGQVERNVDDEREVERYENQQW